MDNSIIGYVAEASAAFRITYDPTAAISFSFSVDPMASVSSQLDIAATTVSTVIFHIFT
jgi:hypothetical protein